jgi:hypothetical protein
MGVLKRAVPDFVAKRKICGLSQSAVKAKFCEGVQLVYSYTRT